MLQYHAPPCQQKKNLILLHMKTVYSFQNVVHIYTAVRIDKFAKNEIVQEGIIEASKTVIEKDLLFVLCFVFFFCFCFF